MAENYPYPANHDARAPTNNIESIN